jgi:hypothetical protein
VIAALIILGAVVYLATGRGGEMPAEQPDYAPLDLGPLSATDIALHRPPAAMWGYSMRATDEALERIAESIRERDVRIVALEQLVTDLSHDPAPTLARGVYMGQRRRGDEDEEGQDLELPAALERPHASPVQPAQEDTSEAEQDQPYPVQWEQLRERGRPGPPERSHD